jgi:hypothetical protein
MARPSSRQAVVSTLSFLLSHRLATSHQSLAAARGGIKSTNLRVHPSPHGVSILKFGRFRQSPFPLSRASGSNDIPHSPFARGVSKFKKTASRRRLRVLLVSHSPCLHVWLRVSLPHTMVRFQYIFVAMARASSLSRREHHSRVWRSSPVVSEADLRTSFWQVDFEAAKLGRCLPWRSGPQRSHPRDASRGGLTR